MGFLKFWIYFWSVSEECFRSFRNGMRLRLDGCYFVDHRISILVLWGCTWWEITSGKYYYVRVRLGLAHEVWLRTCTVHLTHCNPTPAHRSPFNVMYRCRHGLIHSFWGWVTQYSF